MKRTSPPPPYFTPSHFANIVGVFLLGIALTYALLAVVQGIDDNNVKQHLYSESTKLEAAFQKRLTIYEEIMRGIAAIRLVDANKTISQDNWDAYVGSTDVLERIRSLTHIGYAQRYNADQIRQISQDDPAHPLALLLADESRTEFAPIALTNGAQTGDPLAIKGYDLLQDPTLRAAMDSARDSGTPSMTHSTFIPRGINNPNNEPELVYFMPIFNTPQPPASTAERRQHIDGYVYVSIFPHTIMDRVVANQEIEGDTQVSIFDGTRSKGEIELYSSSRSPSDGPSVSTTIAFGNLSWRLNVATKNPDAYRTGWPYIVITVGAMCTVLAAVLVHTALRYRKRQSVLEQQAKLQVIRDELMSLASHQLRTPASGVKQYLGMLLEGFAGDLSPQQRELIEKADTINNRQIEIVDQILLATDVGGAKLRAAMRHEDITQLVVEVIDEQRLSHKTHHTLAYQPSRQPIFASIDRDYIKVAIENVIGNAYKYTPDHGTINVSVSQDDTSVAIAVTDSGVGIAPSDQDRLFEKFSRIPNELSIKAGGSGIGLYVVKELVEGLHDGTIAVSSAGDGTGSTFTITLPIQHRINSKKVVQ
jgi:signal transduction histidine kinase